MQLRASSRFRVSTFFSVLYYTLEIFLPPQRYIRGANGHGGEGVKYTLYVVPEFLHACVGVSIRIL